MSNLSKDVSKANGLLQKELMQWRRHLHKHPELSFDEYETAHFVAEVLKGIVGFSVQTNVGGTGVVATLTKGLGRTVAIRADMDALPITEINSFDYCSLYPGIMHACGHDAHTAILLGVAKIVSEMSLKEQFQGTIKLIFQPAEESNDEEGLSGASHMIREGVLTGVDSVIALHMCPWHPVGTIQVNDGYSLANVDNFRATIRGTGGHGGYPHLGTDPIWMLGFVLQAFYGLQSRKISALDTAVASIGQINTGTANNIIPEVIEIIGTMRTYSPIIREQLSGEVENAFKIVESLGGNYTFDLDSGEPALENNPEINHIIKEAAKELFPDIQVDENPFGLGGEDFGYMTKEVPGSMFFLGCALQDGVKRDLHTNIFDIDEDCLIIGSTILAQSAMKLLIS